ncbi:o-succinylbenzoate--CoA ligase [Liquorilactobacillus oeni]|uniref:2-succinylbenzoate--CoA ligase n=1 Tax=Liquorilactobacillus oeni DSM 19972 TaxID=1423777 RepID=A0A0R1MDT1_9LACO|nr:o-succinylbenzoate--CoA ligase [Liquorilactobacillus oeni]KRL05913.1 menaquinone biosynthesis O-succinylbenzoic acid-CoA ligase [Liquorilactobacillus oeni DSM 19972]
MENWLTKQAKLVPQKTALIFEEHIWSFKQLKNEVIRTAGCLTKANLQREHRIALIPANTSNSYFMLLALQQLGITPVLLNFRLSSAELERQLDNAHLKVVLFDDELALRLDGCKELQKKWFVSSLAEIRKSAAAQPVIKQEFPETSTASIMYTSGTTGNPHGVIQSFRNHFYSAVGSAFNLGVSPDDLWLCAVPLFHISGLSIVMRSLVYGMGVLLTRRFEAAEITRLLCRQPVTLMSVVPQMLEQLLAVFPKSGYQKHFRAFLLGGAAISKTTLAACQEKKLAVIQSYGMTETCSQIVALNFADAARKIGSVGKPLFPVQLRIAGQDEGEIQIKAPNVVSGYLNNKDQFEKKLTSDGWFRTGDIGTLDTEGFLFVKGRSDEMFVSGGENIFPNEIEEVYMTLPIIQEIAVIGVSDKKWGEVPCAFFVAAKELDKKFLCSYGRKVIAHYKVPKYFIQVSQLPHTASGKIKHYALRNYFESNQKTSF